MQMRGPLARKRAEESGARQLQRATNREPQPAPAARGWSHPRSFARQIVGEAFWKRCPFHPVLAARLRDAQPRPDANSAAAGTARMNSARALRTSLINSCPLMPYGADCLGNYCAWQSRPWRCPCERSGPGLAAVPLPRSNPDGFGRVDPRGLGSQRNICSQNV